MGFSQNKTATLYLQDGTKISGLTKINSYDEEIKFRVDKNSESVAYNAENFEKLFVEEHDDVVEYQYKLINVDKSRLYLLILRIEGVVSLYEYYKSLPGDGGKKSREKNQTLHF